MAVNVIFRRAASEHFTSRNVKNVGFLKIRSNCSKCRYKSKSGRRNHDLGPFRWKNDRFCVWRGYFSSPIAYWTLGYAKPGIIGFGAKFKLT